MKPTEKLIFSYIAGIFDTIGAIHIIVPRKLKIKRSASLLVWVTSKSFKLMEILQKYGALISKKQDGQYRAKWRDKKAFIFLSNIVDYLVLKKEQAKVAIEFIQEKSSTTEPVESIDAIYRLRLKLCKRHDGTEN